jgi:hypothetical protein
MTTQRRASGRHRRGLPSLVVTLLLSLLTLCAVASPAWATSEEEVYFNAIAENLKGGHTGVGYIYINQGEGFEGTSCINEYETGGSGTTPSGASKNCAGKDVAETDSWIGECKCLFLGHAQVWNAHGSPAHIWGWWRF